MRTLKMQYKYGANEIYPSIKLEGKWLKDIGFEPGDTIIVEDSSDEQYDLMSITIKKQKV